MKKYRIDNVRGAEFCQVDTNDVLKSMPGNLRRNIIKGHESGKYAHSYSKIDQDLLLLSEGKPIPHEIKFAMPKTTQPTRKKKEKSKANFWWETWGKDNG